MFDNSGSDLELKVYNLSELSPSAKKIIDFADKHKIWLFFGEMGSGKTTLIKSICNELNVTDEVTSPSFTIINEYQTAYDETIYHFDFFRIKDENEAFDIGIEEYLESGSLCFIEWPEKVTHILPEKRLAIIIKANKDLTRLIQLKKYE